MKRITTKQPEKIATLQQCRYFKNVSDVILFEISEGMNLYQFSRSEPIFWEGEVCKGLYIIKQGNIKIYKLSQQGREMIINVLGNGDSFNEVSVFDEDPNPVNVAALSDCQIWIVNAGSIRSCLHKYPEVTRAVILNLSKNLRMMVGKIEELSFFQVTTRLARLIENLTKEELQGENQVRLTRDEMAARLGTVREVVARSLKELDRSGAVQVTRRKIVITDKIRLKEWSQEI